MKFKADRATLLKALAHIQSVAEKRNTIPILANARIDVVRGKLSLTATDMEIAVVEDVPATAPRRAPCMRSCANCPTALRSNWTRALITPSFGCAPANTAPTW
jgi:DNA polymerase-3 subunit beta